MFYDNQSNNQTHGPNQTPPQPHSTNPFAGPGLPGFGLDHPSQFIDQCFESNDANFNIPSLPRSQTDHPPGPPPDSFPNSPPRNTLYQNYGQAQSSSTNSQTGQKNLTFNIAINRTNNIAPPTVQAHLEFLCNNIESNNCSNDIAGLQEQIYQILHDDPTEAQISEFIQIFDQTVSTYLKQILASRLSFYVTRRSNVWSRGLAEYGLTMARSTLLLCETD
jgi:hypothetical protein